MRVGDKDGGWAGGLNKELFKARDGLSQKPTFKSRDKPRRKQARQRSRNEHRG